MSDEAPLSPSPSIKARKAATPGVKTRLASKRAMSEAASMMTEAINALPVAVSIATHSPTKLLFVNTEWEAMTGYKGKEVVNKSFEFLQLLKDVSPKEGKEPKCLVSDKLKAYLDLKKNAEEPAQFAVEMENVTKDGCSSAYSKRFWNYITMIPFKFKPEGEAEEQLFWVAMHKDRTKFWNYVKLFACLFLLLLMAVCAIKAGFFGYADKLIVTVKKEL